MTDKGLRARMDREHHVTPKPMKKAPKRKTGPKLSKAEQNNNVKRQRMTMDNKDDMLATYQPWVIQTYGDLAKTKTITLKKYARILRTLRGDEVVSADNSKFRFWVKAKGFCVGQPVGYEAKPADAIVGRYSVCDMDDGIPVANEKLSGSAKDPPLYVPNAPFKVHTIYLSLFTFVNLAGITKVSSLRRWNACVLYLMVDCFVGYESINSVIVNSFNWYSHELLFLLFTSQ